MLTKSNLLIVSFIIAICIIGLISCDSSSPFGPQKLHSEAPNFSLYAFPNSTTTPQQPGITLQWSCSDPNGDPLTYSVYLGTTKFPALVAEGLTVPRYTPLSLQLGKHYYWWVAAKDSDGNITHSPRWEFITGSDIVYPLAVGNQWEYTGSTYWIDPETGKVIDTLPSYNFHSVIAIISYDTLLNHFPAYHFYEETYEYFSAHHNTAESYFNNTSEGFFQYAYSGYSATAPLKIGNGYSIEFMGQQFHNIRELLSFTSVSPDMSIRYQAAANGRLIYEDPPIKSLAYPLEIGKQWVARPKGGLWRINKEVTEMRTIRTIQGIHECYVITWLYYNDFINRDYGAVKVNGPGPGGNGDTGYDEPIITTLDTNIVTVDYISASGLLRRNITLKNIIYSDYQGTPIDTLNVIIKWDITNVELKQ